MIPDLIHSTYYADASPRSRSLGSSVFPELQGTFAQRNNINTGAAIPIRRRKSALIFCCLLNTESK